MLSDEFEARDILSENRKNIKSFDDLVSFLKDVEEHYNYDYGVAPRAIAQASLAVAWHLAEKFGITGFQAGFTMWDFIRDWQYSGNRCGLKIVDYDNMLYPQYQYKFEKTINESTWVDLQKEAKKNLEECEESGIPAHPNVMAHWKSIVEGKVPFGYTVKRD